jgi:acyl-CoA synthetase (AMP-forming)/AMP-acid ligase II
LTHADTSPLGIIGRKYYAQSRVGGLSITSPSPRELAQIYYPLLFLAVIGAGAVFVGSNPGYKEIELTSLLETSKASLVITAPDLLPTVQTVTKKLRISDSRVLVFAEALDTPDGFRSWFELFQHGEDDWIQFDNEKTARETPACLVTTSGTTGLPKMAVLSHHAWVALNCVIDDPNPKPYQIKRWVKSIKYFQIAFHHLAICFGLVKSVLIHP